MPLERALVAQTASGRQKPVPLVYKDTKLECGYRIDLLVESRIVVELKFIEALGAHTRSGDPDLYPSVWLPPRAAHQFQRHASKRGHQAVQHLKGNGH